VVAIFPGKSFLDHAADEMESVNTPDGGRRPPSYLILGLTLEPHSSGVNVAFSKLNPDVDALIDALLNFDPDHAGQPLPAKPRVI